MKAFVTGGTGLLGNNLVKALADNGWQVKALARSREKAAKLLDTGRVEIVVGDMENVAGFADALAGCDVLFHTAAYFRDYFGPGDHWAKLEQINVKATIELLNEAERRGVGKTIYVSSSTVIGHKPDGTPGDETTPPDETAYQNLYAKSKVLAEEAVAGWLKAHKMPVVLILPSAIFGPGDAAPTSSGKLIVDFLKRKLPVIPPGGFSVVDVRDVAHAMLNAVEHGKSGERYIVSSADYSIKDILYLLSEITSIPAPRLQMPYTMALIYGWVAETRARLTGTESTASVNAIRTLNARRVVKSDKAQRELAFSVRPFADTLRDSVMWFRQQEYV
jgi:dihydroflavonol-4-reductase